MTPHLVEGVPSEAVWATMQHLAKPAAEGFVAMTGEGVELYGAECPLPKRLQHLYSCPPVEPVHVQQPGNARIHWMPVAVDGTSRHEASYVHCTLGGTSSPDQLASWWLLGLASSGPRCTQPRMRWASTNNCGMQVRLYSRIPAVRTARLFFFPFADGKAQILMANCKNWKAEAPQAMVRWVCGCNRAQRLADFGLEDTIDGWWDVVLPIGATYRHIAAHRRISGYVLHGVLCVTICGISGMCEAMAAATGKSAAVVVRHLFQPIRDVARIQAKTVTKGRYNNDKANTKGKVRLECAAAVQFMRTGRWEALLAICLEEGGMNNKRVGSRLWGGVCREWWDNFAKMCVYAWQTGWMSGGNVGRLHECSIRMVRADLVLQWSNVLWSHLWIDHMYFFACKWGILSKLSYFAMEGSHRRLKRMCYAIAGAYATSVGA